MPSVRYVGDSSTGVFLPGDVFVAHNADIEVTPDLAKSLLSQPGPQFIRTPTKPDTGKKD